MEHPDQPQRDCHPDCHHREFSRWGRASQQREIARPRERRLTVIGSAQWIRLSLHIHERSDSGYLKPTRRANSDIEMHAFGSNCRRRPTNVRSSIALRDLTDGQQGRRHTSAVGRPSNRTSLVEWPLVVPAQDRFEPDERACCPNRDRPAASSAWRRDRQGATCGSTIRRSHVLRLATNGR
jgi:hypothetical protein